MAKDGDLKEIKTKYEVARKKYKLPSFEDVDREFEIRLMDDSGFVIRETRRAMLNRIQNMSTFFLPVLSPNPQDLHSLVEMGAFNKKEKDVLFKFYRKLSHLLHKGVTAGIISEKAEAEFIKEIYSKWTDLKKEAAKFMQKITAEWANNKKKAKEDVHYLG